MAMIIVLVQDGELHFLATFFVLAFELLGLFESRGNMILYKTVVLHEIGVDILAKSISGLVVLSADHVFVYNLVGETTDIKYSAMAGIRIGSLRSKLIKLS